MFDLIIKNGTVITTGFSKVSDVGIRGEKISALGDLSASKAEHEIDAEGLMVMPGSVDAHVHFHLYVGGGLYSTDDFFTGGRTAAMGGVTTIIDFVHPEHGEDPFEALGKRFGEAKDCPIDYGLFFCINESSGPVMDAVPELINKGIAAFKVYTTYKKAGIYLDDAGLYNLLKLCARHNGLVSVHAESDQLIEFNVEQAASQGELAPVYHALTRPPIVEAEAVRRVIFFAKKAGTSVHIMHVSSRDGLRELLMGKADGAFVTGETCPHYLLLPEEKLEGPDDFLFTMTPPLRREYDHEALWEGLKNKEIYFITTDHCPFTFGQKEKHKDDFRKIPKGIGGTGTLLPLIYSEGVVKERITPERMVELLCENPARHYGIFPEKGCLLPGADADVVIFDPEGDWTITPESIGSACDYSVYQGMKLKGRVRKVLRRGKIIVDEGKFIKPEEPGKFIKRKTG